MSMRIVCADGTWNNIDIEKDIFPKDWIIEGFQCKTEEDIIRVCKDADAILVEYAPVTRRVLEELKNCKIISEFGTGYDNIDIKAASELNIAVANVPNYCTEDVADHTFALILSSYRNIVSTQFDINKGSWGGASLSTNGALQGKTIGLVGYGNIAQEVASRARAFSMRVISYTSVPDHVLYGNNVERVSLEDLLNQSDIISSHIPYNETNADFFNKATFSMMAKKPYFINTSRGKVVNEEDLIEALKNGIIKGAALDVLRNEPPDFSSPLFSMENVIITPHVAYYSVESVAECRSRSSLNVLNYLEGRANLVDFV